MALGIEMERKRDAAQMSAAAVGFFLDREGHKKFLRTTTNQELEAENKKLKEELADKAEECGYWYTEARSYERSWKIQLDGREELERELDTTKQHLNHFKKSLNEEFEKRREAQEEKHKLEDRIRKAMRRALHPDWPSSEDEEEEQEEDNSPSPSFAE